MQEETTNPFEGLSEEDLQRITGGCGGCEQDRENLANAHQIVQAYRSGNRRGISPEQFHDAREQGFQAYYSLLRRHRTPSITGDDASRAEALALHPDDPPLGWLGRVVDPKASSHFERG